MNSTPIRVLVSGATGTLGAAVYRAFSAAGARVALVDVSTEIPASLEIADSNRHISLLGTDLTKPVQAKAAVDKVVDAFGGLDVLVNVAGGFRWEKIENGDPGVWDRMYTINLKTALNASQAAIPSIVSSGNRGRIINLGAGAATKAAAGMGCSPQKFNQIPPGVKKYS